MKQARWLTPDEQRAWRALLSATHLLFDQLDHELQRDAGIPHAYYEILVRLSESPNRAMRMSDLADRAQYSRSRLSHAAARLEELGWIKREECPTDRRGAFATLTDKGFAALEAAAPGHVAGVRAHLFDRLSPEQVSQLRDIGEVVTTHLETLSCRNGKGQSEGSSVQPSCDTLAANSNQGMVT